MMRTALRFGLSLGALLVAAYFFPGSARAAEKQPIEVIEDNSFLIEEAYNQEPGVVQHSFSTVYNGDSRRSGWSFNFTQECPVFSQDHQISYTVPSYHFVDGSDRIHGLG